MNKRILTGGLLCLLLATSACTQENGQEKAGFLPPLMGWSSWNTYHVNINEELIKKQADALVSQGLKDAGYLYINVDDGFFGHRDETGKMHAHPERFPNGMRVVSDYIHSLGLKAGIYSDAGDNTCGSIYDDDANGVGAGLYGHEQQDMDLYLKEWNYDFIKIDYCGARELGLNEEKRYTTICEAIRNTGRTDVSINICRWAFPGTWARQLARSWRISPDIRPNWNSVKHIIEKNLYLSAYAGEGHYNDMDMLEIGRGLSPAEEETHFGMWCIMSSPLLIGCDLTTIPEASLALGIRGATRQGLLRAGKRHRSKAWNGPCRSFLQRIRHRLYILHSFGDLGIRRQYQCARLDTEKRPCARNRYLPLYGTTARRADLPDGSRTPARTFPLRSRMGIPALLR